MKPGSLLLAALFAAWRLAAAETALFVSPTGDDANPGTDAKPIRTITKARDAVRALSARVTGDITVFLRGGVFPLSETLVLDHRDSGQNGHAIIYRNHPGEVPILSGGKRVTAWTPDAGQRWKAPAPVSNFRQLYINGTRRQRAHGVPPPDLRPNGNTGYRTSLGAMADWQNPQDLELCWFNVWCHTRCRVQAIRRDGTEAVITMLPPWFDYARNKEGVQLNDPAFMENALELLDEPGEWYLDRARRVVFYLPLANEDPHRVEAVVPALERLLELRGTLDQPVHDVRFEGLTFVYAGWLQPSEIGHVDVQANFALDPKNKLERDGKLTVVHNEHLKSPANIVCHAANSVRFERCTFTHLGGAGLDLEYGSHDNTIVGCEFSDISGSALQLGDTRRDDHHPADPRTVVRNNTVANSAIHHVAVEYQGGLGIFVGYTEGTRLTHNEISYLPYSGVSIGWGWGEEDAGAGALNYFQPFRFNTPTPAGNNLIASNHIHHVLQKLKDGGAIYTLGNMPGTVIGWNHLHDNRGEPGGIYLDEGSGFIEVTGNLVYRVKTPLNYNNRAQGRNATCREHDNFFNVVPDKQSPPEIKNLVEQTGIQLPWQRSPSMGRELK